VGRHPVDPVTNQAFVVQSGTGSIQIVPLSTSSSNAPNSAQITEVIVPSPIPVRVSLAVFPKLLFLRVPSPFLLQPLQTTWWACRFSALASSKAWVPLKFV